MARKRKRRIWLYILLALMVLILTFIVYYRMVTRMDPPTDVDPLEMGYERDKIGEGFFQYGKSWFRTSETNIQMYLEGGPLELGIMHGLLARELVESQESFFVDQIKVMIPSESYLNFLKYFTAWFNKDLDKYIKEEYLLEIYGVSAFASDSFEFIGPKYDRILNYHAAHDIGHALQNMDLVKCTAFGVWDEKSSDSSIVIGRNFDFYVGDKFSRHKIVAFINPEQGYKFASITWAGMIGVVSGMNEKGLTLTLNSAKSDIPFGAKTPVSIIAREILQYASNIEEAMVIASSREAFVSESFLIGSAADHKAVVIEKSIDTTVLYDPDTNYLILTNHFQSDYFQNTSLTQENMANETSVYRHERVQELIDSISVFNYEDAAVLLRNRKGMNGKNIGLGNEKAVNQLIAHHSIIFKPEERKFWICTDSWGMSTYYCYALDSVFGLEGNPGYQFIDERELRINPEYSWVLKGENSAFYKYKKLLKDFQQAIKNEMPIEDEQKQLEAFISYNPELYVVYSTLGQYFEMLGNNEEAIKYYKLAMTKEVASRSEKEAIQERIERCKEE
jgi:hypothetical protein